MLGLSYSLADQHFERGKSIGIFNVSRGLAARLARHTGIRPFTVFLNDSLHGKLDLPPTTAIQVFNGAVRSRVGRIVWDQLGVYRAALRSGNEWLLLAKGFASFLTPCPVRLAAIVYDTMHDYYDRTYPDFISAPERWYFRKSLAATFRQASVIFTISDFAAQELRRVAKAYRLPCPPVVAMGIGFAATPSSGSPRTDERILLLVGPTPHKATRMAIDYLTRWQRESGFRGAIDCVGRLPAGTALPDLPAWRLHGRLPDEEYQRLLQSARIVIFCSEYEGFGMPPVEAVLAGACPVYSDIPVTREVMHGTGCPFSNQDFESFRNAMNDSLQVSGSEIADWGTRLLRRHDWAAVEARVIDGLSAYR